MNRAPELRIAIQEKEVNRTVSRWSNADRLVIVVTFVLIFLAAARTPVDTDMWWHLRSGETTLSQGSPLVQDSYSFTRFGQPWVNHSWLAQVGMYLLYDWGGYLAFGAVLALLAAGMLGLIFLQQDGPVILRAFLLVFAMTVMAVVWSPRPQSLSLLLFALTGYVLYQYKWRQFDALLFLVPLFWLWSNLHGGYTLGLLLIGTTVGGEMLNQVLHYSGPEIMGWRKIRKLGLIGLLCGLVVIINPNGFNTWLIPFQTIGLNVIQNYVSEWAAPDFQDAVQQPLLWLTLALLVSMIFSKRRIDGSDLASVLLFGAMAFLARRNFGPFALAAVPVLSRHFWPILQRLQAWFHQRWSGRRQAAPEEGPERIPYWKRGLNLFLVAVIGLAAMGKLYFVTHPVFVEAHIRTLYPVGAIEWMQRQDLSGKVFNEYAWGGYLVWKLRENPVFVDGRTDLFGDAIIEDWMEVVQADAGWNEVLQRWQPDLILIDPGRPVVPLLQEEGWQVLYQDEIAVLFGR